MSEMKMVVVIRRDLGMRRGKEIAQSIHAAFGAFHDSMARWGPIGPDMLVPWEEDGRKKVALKIDGEAALLGLAAACEKANIGHYLVRDAGKTEIPPQTPTALGIGPDFSRHIDKITGELEIY